ncbi:MAG: heme o synthase [Pseudomonadota bacterium]
MSGMVSSAITRNTASDSTVSDYISLTKPRVMTLVVFSGIAGMVMAPGPMHPLIAFVATLCIALASGGAAAINMWYDRDIDTIMLRTQNRPIVKGKIAPEEALAFGVILSFFAVMFMAVCVSYLASLLLLASILFYVFIYTIWLKRSSVQNIVIGGAAGAFPPMIGWAAVTGNVTIESMILFLLIFLWTPPHFWALALYKSDDYKKCNIPMMPIVKGDLYTKKQIILYSCLMVAISILPSAVGMTGVVYACFAIMLGAWFLYDAVSLLSDQTNRLAPRLFFFSIIYLFAIFGFMMIDHYIKF